MLGCKCDALRCVALRCVDSVRVPNILVVVVVVANSPKNDVWMRLRFGGKRLAGKRQKARGKRQEARIRYMLHDVVHIFTIAASHRAASGANGATRASCLRLRMSGGLDGGK